MRQMQNNFRQSIAFQQALQEAKNQPTIVRSTSTQLEQTTEIPVEPVTEIQPEFVAESKQTTEQSKITTTTQTTKLPNLGK